MPERHALPPYSDTTVPSPCVRNCCLDEQDICLGCFRHVQEVMDWGTCTNEEKRLIIKRAVARKNAALQNT